MSERHPSEDRVVTGANRGIGRAAAEGLAALGMTGLVGTRLERPPNR